MSQFTPARFTPHTLAALRIVAGLLFLAHGLVKIAGFPAGAEPGQQASLSLLGIGGLIETVTGTLLIFGLFTRPAAFLASGQMAIAYWFFHAPQSSFPVINGGDASILFTFVFLLLAAAGPGSLAVDNRKVAADGPPLRVGPARPPVPDQIG